MSSEIFDGDKVIAAAMTEMRYPGIDQIDTAHRPIYQRLFREATDVLTHPAMPAGLAEQASVLAQNFAHSSVEGMITSENEIRDLSTRIVTVAQAIQADNQWTDSSLDVVPGATRTTSFGQQIAEHAAALNDIKPVVSIRSRNRRLAKFSDVTEIYGKRYKDYVPSDQAIEGAVNLYLDFAYRLGFLGEDDDRALIEQLLIEDASREPYQKKDKNQQNEIFARSLKTLSHPGEPLQIQFSSDIQPTSYGDRRLNPSGFYLDRFSIEVSYQRDLRDFQK